MGFVSTPHFPTKRVSYMATDKCLESDMKNELLQLGIELIEIPPCRGVSDPVAGHPDMQMVHLKENVLLCHPQFPKAMKESLQSRGFFVYMGHTVLREKYPHDIAYNVAIVGRVAFHNMKYTDPALASLLDKLTIRLVHVNQGYTKCSVLPVTSESMITADIGIAKAAKNEGMDVLLIPPQKSICLPGFDYGFVGGCAGFISPDTLAFTGDLELLESRDTVKCFLDKYGIKWISLGNGNIRDYGGLLPLCEGWG